MLKKITKAYFENLFKCKFAEDSKVLPKEMPLDEVNIFLKDNLVIKTENIEDYLNYGLNKDEYIREKKSLLIDKIGKSDPIQTLLIEKLCAVCFINEYINRKFPNSELIMGVSPQSNKLSLDVEYYRSLLIFQISFLAEALNFAQTEIDDVFIFQRGLRLTPTPSKAKKEQVPDLEAAPLPVKQTRVRRNSRKKVQEEVL